MPLMEKRERDIFREPVFFSISSPFDVEQSVPLAIWFKKKKCSVLVHIPQLLYVQLKNGEGEKERTEDLDSLTGLINYETYDSNKSLKFSLLTL